MFLRGAAAEKAAPEVFALADDRGDDRAVLQVVPDGTPVLVLFDKTGRVIWKTP
ncbi:MAG: hypothetical protein HYV94_01685 [Candidatus Rokubacteria bacterium]|nr:hypothetical protein [Candidatus Rokubacteria bacterium]